MRDASFFVRLAFVQDKYVVLIHALENAADECRELTETGVLEEFLDLEDELTRLLTDYDEQSPQYSLIKALLKYQIGSACHRTPERAESYLKAALKIVRAYVLNPDCILLAVSILSKLGALLVDQRKFREAGMCLWESRHILNTFNFKESRLIVSLEDLFLDKERQMEKVASYSSADFHVEALRKLYLDSLKYHWSGLLAQIDEKSYFESFKWPQNLIEFFNVVVLSRKFRLTRHILSCANQLCTEYEKVLKNKSDKSTELWMKLHHTKADFSMTWGMYAFHILKQSNLQLSGREESFFSKTDESEAAFLKISTEHPFLPANKVEAFESKVDVLVSEKENARKVFDFGRKELYSAKQYFAEINNLKELVSVNRTIAKSCYFLQCFETDVTSKCQLLQDAIGLIEELWINVTQEKHPELHRDIAFDVGEYYYYMAKLKRESMAASDDTSERTASNLFAYKAIVQLLSLKSEELSATLRDDVARRILEAHAYYIDSLLLVLGSRGEMVTCTLKALKSYKLLRNYLNRNPSHLTYVHTTLKTINQRSMDAQKEMEPHIPSACC